MYYLIYTSQESEVMKREDLADILEKSNANNNKNDITGLLIYLSGRFIQLLEGDKEKVNSTFGKIKEDKRHSKVTQVLSGYLQERLFKEWDMALKKSTLEDFEKITGFKSIEDLNSLSNTDNSSHPALIFLKHHSNQALKHYTVSLQEF